MTPEEEQLPELIITLLNCRRKSTTSLWKHPSVAGGNYIGQSYTHHHPWHIFVGGKQEPSRWQVILIFLINWNHVGATVRGHLIHSSSSSSSVACLWGVCVDEKQDEGGCCWLTEVGLCGVVTWLVWIMRLVMNELTWNLRGRVWFARVKRILDEEVTKRTTEEGGGQERWGRVNWEVWLLSMHSR